MKSPGDFVATGRVRVYRAAACWGALVAGLGMLSVRAVDFAVPSAGGFARIVDIRQFGARGDGKTVNTEAIQKALDECGQAGGGVVRIPAGTYLSKPIFLRDHTTLQLDALAILKATDEPSDFADPEMPGSLLAFVNGKNLVNITIAGPGRIDGAGIRWWVTAELMSRQKPGYNHPRPRIITLTNCKHLRVCDLTLQNSPGFHLNPVECDDVLVTNVTVRSASDAPNSDGIVLGCCKDVLVTRCLTDLGGDNISIKSPRAVPNRAVASQDITVSNCTFLRGHGMAIGSDTIGGVSNVTVWDCTFNGTQNGLFLKSQRGRGGLVEHIRYGDITMRDVDLAVTFTSYYLTNSENDTAQALRSTTPVFRDIQISNLTASCQSTAGIILGLPESPISEVVLESVRISAITNGFTIRNARGVQLRNTQVTLSQGQPFILSNAEVEGMDAPDFAPVR
jgi:polygalacturonase